MAFFKRRENKLKRDRNDAVFKVFIKNDDGTLNEDVLIYRDGTWESVYVPKDRRTMLLHDLHQRVRASVLEDYKKNVKENWHSDAALPPFVPAHKEDRDAYTTLCGVCGQPRSLDLNDCVDPSSFNISAKAIRGRRTNYGIESSRARL